jgi:plasmid maintenance system killer protein
MPKKDKRFFDERTREVFETRFAPGVPEHVSIAAHEMIRILSAATSLQDVSVLGTIHPYGSKNHFALAIEKKWHVTFAWSESSTAADIQLRRL